MKGEQFIILNITTMAIGFLGGIASLYCDGFVERICIATFFGCIFTGAAMGGISAGLILDKFPITKLL